MRSKYTPMVFSAMLITLSVILTRFLSINPMIGGTVVIRLGLGLLPILFAGVFLGPVYGAIVGGLADLIGALLFPIGPYFPGFTLSSALMGLIPGVCYIKRNTHWPMLLGTTTVSLAVGSVLLNTLWMQMIAGKGYWVYLLPRLVAAAIMIPAFTFMLYVLCKALRPVRFGMKER